MITKTDLAPLVGADLAVMDRDAERMRAERPLVFTNIRPERGCRRWLLSSDGRSRSAS